MLNPTAAKGKDNSENSGSLSRSTARPRRSPNENVPNEALVGKVVREHTIESPPPPNRLIYQKELTFAIMFSGWWRFLWTLQEGLLTDSIVMVIGEGVIQLQQVVAATNTDHVNNRADMLSETLKVTLHNLIDRAWNFGHIYHRRKILTLVCNRSTSHLTDEPPCLAMLMGLDVAESLKTPREKRMA